MPPELLFEIGEPLPVQDELCSPLNPRYIGTCDECEEENLASADTTLDGRTYHFLREVLGVSRWVVETEGLLRIWLFCLVLVRNVQSVSPHLLNNAK